MKIFKLVKSVEIYPLNGSDKANWIDVDRVKFPTVKWTEIYIKRHGTLTIKDKLDFKTRVFTAELQLYTPEAINLDVPYLWRIGLVDGTYRLIGDGNRPYPVATLTETAPELATDNQLNIINVTYSSDKTVPYIM